MQQSPLNLNCGIFMSHQKKHTEQTRAPNKSERAFGERVRGMRVRAHGHVRRPLLSNRKLLVLSLLFVVLSIGVVTGTKATLNNWDAIYAGTQEFIARQIDARVKSVMVAGTQNAKPAKLRTALGIEHGDSLVGFDAQKARQNLQALDWVKSAGVVRVLPSTVKVEIDEHAPLSRLEYQGDVWILGANGQLITKDYKNFESLPVLRGKGAQENAATLLKRLAEAEMLDKIIAGVYVGERRWDAEFQSGAIVKLPEENTPQALAYLRVLQKERNLLDVPDVMIDLRLPDKIVLRLPDGKDSDYL